jgi:hypothetical protein
MIQYSKKNPQHIIQASRWNGYNNNFNNYGLIKMILNFFFQKIFSLIYNVNCNDLTFGFRLMPSFYLKKEKWEMFDHSFLLESVLKPIMNGAKIIAIDSKWKKRIEGKSYNQFSNYFRYLYIGVWIYLKNKKKKMKKFIISTTIKPPTLAIKKFDNFKDWTLIVVGDLKTPKNYKLQNGIYLSCKDQNLLDKKLSNIIGWNCIERRNLGIVLAKKHDADVVALVDDDNIPYKDWGKNLLVGKKKLINTYEVKTPVFDPINVTKYKNLWHRGFPLNLLDYRKATLIGKKKITINVQADFWDGDPDIDAITRIMFRPKCKFEKNIFPFYSKKISPFNSQNTFLSSDLLKDYFLFPDQGRMHDIWASYFLQYRRNINVVYNKASVFQKRNIHTSAKDLSDELIGLKYTSKLINQMMKKKFNYKKFFSKRSIDAYKEYLKHF